MNRDDLPVVPHSILGRADCCGFLVPVERGDEADLFCNECGAFLLTVLASDVAQALVRLSMAHGLCTEICPHCGSLNSFHGWSSMMAYICQECGEAVSLDPPIQ